MGFKPIDVTILPGGRKVRGTQVTVTAQMVQEPETEDELEPDVEEKPKAKAKPKADE